MAKAEGYRRVFEEITPEKAQLLLSQRPFTRRLREYYCQALAGLIKAGKWRNDNPEGIMVNCKGEVIDGQHRLRAIVIAQQSARPDVEICLAIALSLPLRVCPAPAESPGTGRRKRSKARYFLVFARAVSSTHTVIAPRCLFAQA